VTSSRFEATCLELRASPKTWLVTGVAGFIGSNLLEALLRLNQRVVGVDNFATGSRQNLEDVRESVGRSWELFRFIESDIVSAEACADACAGVEIVLHNAALGSVPRSLKDPASSHRVNVDGFVNMFLAARDAGVQRFIYASSSAVYGDHPALPKVESVTGTPLSPYAATKVVDELYARVFGDAYRIPTIGLRYFNVFGRRQSPEGPYTAVIPRWISAMLQGRPCTIYGDGTNSRDFCYVENVLQANLLAGVSPKPESLNQVYNIAVGHRTTLISLYELIRDTLSGTLGKAVSKDPTYAPARAGDIPHSHADISKAASLLGYAPTHDVSEGLIEAIAWYASRSVSTLR
jgi:UDP-N-acetylglucosamine/UDP-N-acetylgalactosamine 4-epimerase